VGTEYDCAAARTDLGVYLLGALEPVQRAEVDQHLRICPRCREQLASLAALPALLRRIPDAQTVLGEPGSAAQPARTGPDQLIHEVARHRRRTRAATAAAAAAGLITVTAVTASLSDHSGAQPTAQTWDATVQSGSSATGVWAQVRYAPRAWGTELETRITGVRPGTRCQLWITGPGSQRTPAGGWTIVSSRGVIWYPASVPSAAGTLRDFLITTSAGRTLVSVPVHPPAPDRLRPT
jgi:hypothetical protein